MIRPEAYLPHGPHDIALMPLQVISILNFFPFDLQKWLMVTPP